MQKSKLFIGSVEYTLLQLGFIVLWLGLNTLHSIPHWDPYPFHLLGIFLLIELSLTLPAILQHWMNGERAYLIEWFQYYQHEYLQVQNQLTKERDQFPLRTPE